MPTESTVLAHAACGPPDPQAMLCKLTGHSQTVSVQAVVLAQCQTLHLCLCNLTWLLVAQISSPSGSLDSPPHPPNVCNSNQPGVNPKFAKCTLTHRTMGKPGGEGSWRFGPVLA